MHRYKLKEVVKAKYKNKLISIKWNERKNAEVAMKEASKYYRNKKNNTQVKDEDEMEDIIDYNKIDCEVLYEIVEYLRDNHCDR